MKMIASQRAKQKCLNSLGTTLKVLSAFVFVASILVAQDSLAQCAFDTDCSATNSYYWCGGSSGNWNVAANWCAANCSTAKGNYPGGGTSGDSACAIIGSCSGSTNATVHFTVGGATERINKVRVYNGSTLAFDNAGNILQVSTNGGLTGEVNVCSGATLSMTVGTKIADGNWNTRLEVIGSMKVDGTLSQTSGLIRFNGATTTTSTTWYNVDIGYDSTAGSWTIPTGTIQTINNAFTAGLSNCNDTLTINSNAQLITSDWNICTTATVSAAASGAAVELTGNSITFPDASATASRQYSKLRISQGTTTLNQDIRVNEELRIDNGTTLDLNGHTLDLRGDLIIDGTGTVTPRNGTIQFNKSGTQTISGTSPTGIKDLGAATVASGATVDNNLDTAIDFTGSLTINSGGVFLAGSNTLYMSNNLNNSGTFTAETSTVVWSNTNYLPTVDFYHLTIDANTRTPSSALYVNGNLTINASRTLRARDNIMLGGNWANYGTFTPSGDSVICNNNCTILTSSTFDGLATTGSGTQLSVDTNLSLTVNDTLTIANGTTFNAGNGTNILLNEDMSLSGTFNPQMSTVDYQGSTIPATDFYNLTVNPDSGTANFAGTLDVENNFVINNGRTFSCGSGDVLQVAGSFTRTGTFNGSGTCTVQFDGAKDTVFTGATTIPYVIVNKSTPDYKVSLQANLTSSTSFILTSGYVEANGVQLNLNSGGTIGDGSGSGDATVEIIGGGSVRVGNGQTLDFRTDSVLRASGSGPSITYTGTGTYTLLVAGKVNISRLNVSYTDTNGFQLTINNPANIETFNYLSFSNIGGGSGTALKVNNTSGSSLSYMWSNHNYNSSLRVNVDVASSVNNITLSMANATGTRRGETYDNDSPPNRAVDWPANIVWEGDDATYPTRWDIDENWSGGFVPDSQSSVTIPNVTNKPVINSADAYVGNITINTGSSLTINAGYTLYLYGTLVNSGTFTADSSSTVNFAGTETQQIPTVTYGNLTVSNTLGAVLSGTTTVNGNLTIGDGATFIGSTNTLNVYGSWNDVSGTGFDYGSGTVNIRSATAANISAGQFYNLTIDDGTKTLDGDITVYNNLTISNDGTLNASNRNVKVKNRFYNQWTTTGGFSAGTHTVFMDCSSTTYFCLTATTSQFNNIKVGSSCTVEVRDGSCNAASRTIDMTGTMTVDNGGTLNGTNDTFQLEGNWTQLGNNSNFTYSGSTIQLDGTGAQEITQGTFNNVIVNKGGGALTATGDMNINGTLDVQNGTFNLGTAHTHYITGTITVANTGGQSATLNNGSSRLVANSNFTTGTAGAFVMSGNTAFEMRGGRTITLNGDFTSSSADGYTPTVTRKSGTTGGITFTIQGGVVNVNGLVFEYGSQNGLNITSGVSAVNALNNVTLTYNQGTSGSNYCLLFGESGTYEFNGMFFDSSCSASNHYNIRATNPPTTSIVMVNYSGAGAGASYESDPNNIITWSSGNRWTGGANSTWSNGSNWSKGSYPVAGDAVVIDTVTNQPSNVDISNQFGSLEIKSGSVLTIGANSATDLTSTGNCTIDSGGALVMGTNNTSDMVCQGDFVNDGTLTQNNNTGYLRLSGSGRSLDTTGTSQAIRRIEIATGASYTLADDLTFDTSATNNFDIRGTLNANTYTITTRDLNISGGTFNAGTGKVVWKGGAIPTSVSYYDLEIDSSTASIAGTLTVTHNLTIKANAALTTSNNTINLTGDLTVETGALVTAGSSAINVGGSIALQGTGEINGTCTITMNTASTDSLSVAGTDKITCTRITNSTGNIINMSGAVGIAAIFDNRGTLNFNGYSLSLSGTGGDFDNNGGTMNMPSSSASLSCNDFTNRNSGSLNFGSSTAALTVSGNYTDSATVTIGLSTVTFTGTSGTITTPNSVDFYNVVFEGTKSAANALDIDGSVTIKSGASFTAGAYTHTVAGNWDNQGGTFTSTGSTISFNGTSTQTVSASTFNNFTVNKSSGVLTATGNLTINGAMSIAAGTFNLGSSLTHSGTSATIASVLNLGSGSTSLSMSGSVNVNSGGQIQMQNAPVALVMGNGTTLNINSGAALVASGSGTNTPTIRSNAGSTHAFNVYGTLNVTGLNHSYPDANGIYIRSGATITAFDNVIHSNNTTSYVRVANITLSGTWTGHVFNGSVGSNVTTDSGGSGTITMTAFSGTRSGESYDNDLGIVVNWQDGIVWEGDLSSNWGTGGNWSSGSVPGGSDTVTIPAGVPNMPVLGANQSIGTITISENASLNLAGYTLSISGGLTNSGTVTHGNGVISLNGSGAQTVNAGSSALYDLEINKTGGTATISGNLTLSHNMTFTTSNTGTLNLSSGTHSISGAVTVNRGTLDVGTSNSTVTGALTAGSASYAGTVSMTQSSAIFTVGSFSGLANGTVTFGTGSAILKVKGNFSNAGTFTIGTGTVSLEASTASTITTKTGDGDFYNLAVTGYYDANDALDINNNLTVSGTLNLGGSSLSHDVANNVTVSNGGMLSFQSAQLTLSGSSKSLTVNLGGMVAMNSSSRLKVTSGGSVSISGGFLTTYSGTKPSITNNGSGTFSFTVNSGGTINVSGLSFANADTNGLRAMAGANVTDLDGIAFTNVASGGTHLRLLVTSGTFDFSSCTFDSSFGIGSGYNVETVGTASVTFSNWSGAGGGPNYDNPKDSSTITWSNQVMWVGGISTDWATGANWSTNNKPDSGADVVIPQVASGYYNPTVNSTETANSLKIQSGGILTIGSSAGVTLNSSITVLSGGRVNMSGGTLSAKADFVNSGTMNFTGGTTYAGGTGNQTFTALTLYHLIVSNTSAAVRLDPTVSTQNFTTNSSTSTIVGSGDTLNVNGNSAVNGSLEMSSGSTLQLASTGTHSVGSSGKFKTSGTSGSPVNVQNSGSGYYTLTLGGQTDVYNTTFKNLNTGGVTLSGTSSPVGNGFTYVTFQDATPSSSLSYLNISSGSSFGGYTFNGLAFQDTAATGEKTISNSASNVTLSNYATGTGWLSGSSTSSGPVTWGPTVVEMVYLAAWGDSKTGRVNIVWQTASERDNLGFVVLKGENINSQFNPVSPLLPGMGSTPFGNEYSYTDFVEKGAGELYYMVQDIDYENNITYHGPVAVEWDKSLKLSGENKNAVDDKIAAPVIPYEQGEVSPIYEVPPMLVDITGDLPDRILSMTDQMKVEIVNGNVNVSVRPDNVVLEQVEENGIEFTKPVVVGLPHFWREKAGEPELPLISIYIKAKSNSLLELDSSVADSNEINSSEIVPAPKQVAPKYEMGNAPFEITETVEKNISAYARKIDPPERVKLVKVSSNAKSDLYRMDIYPLAYKPLKNTILPARQMNVTVKMNSLSLANQVHATLRDVNSNCESNMPQSAIGYVSTRNSGVKRVTFSELALAGVDITKLSPQKIEVRRGFTQQVATELEGVEDGVIDPDDAILFYAEVPEDQTSEAYFVFTGDGMNRVSMPVVPPPSGEESATVYETDVFDGNEMYSSILGEEENKDRFLFSSVTVGGVVELTGSYKFTLDSVKRSEDKAQISADFVTMDDGDTKRIYVRLNGYEVGTYDFDGTVYHLSAEIPALYFVGGENELLVDIQDPQVLAPELGKVSKNYYSAVWLARITAKYPVNGMQVTNASERIISSSDSLRDASASLAVEDPLTARVWDITNAIAPRQVSVSAVGNSVSFVMKASAGKLLVSSADDIETMNVQKPLALNLRCSDAGADYLVIAPEEWGDDVQALLDLRKNQGLSTHFIPLPAIAEQFGEGNLTTASITAFIEYALERYSNPPRFITLVGSDNLDARALLATTDLKEHPQIVPSWMPFTKNYGETPSDYLYATTNKDIPPLVAIGRIPARSREQLAHYIEKLSAYELTPIEHLWERNVVVISDKEEDFEALADSLDGIVNSNFLIGDITGRSFSTNSEFTASITNELNKGALVTNYLGHASASIWSRSYVYANDNIEQLANNDRQTILISSSCLNGFYNYPDRESMSETFLNAEGGAVGVIASSGLHATNTKQVFNEALFSSIFARDERRVGEILKEGWLAHLAAYDNADEGDVNKTYFLLGDSALLLRSPVPERPSGVTAVRQGETVSISWKQNPETDVVGYNIYRTELFNDGTGSEDELLTEQPIAATNFVDSSLEVSGTSRHLVYRVQAVDFEGLFSKLSQGIEVTVGLLQQNTEDASTGEDATVEDAAADAGAEDVAVTVDGGDQDGNTAQDVESGDVPETDTDIPELGDDAGEIDDSDWSDNTERDCGMESSYDGNTGSGKDAGGSTGGGGGAVTESDSGTGESKSDSGTGESNIGQDSGSSGAGASDAGLPIEGSTFDRSKDSGVTEENSSDKQEPTESADETAEDDGDSDGCSCRISDIRHGMAPVKTFLIFAMIIGSFVCIRRRRA